MLGSFKSRDAWLTALLLVCAAGFGAGKRVAFARSLGVLTVEERHAAWLAALPCGSSEWPAAAVSDTWTLNEQAVCGKGPQSELVRRLVGLLEKPAGADTNGADIPVSGAELRDLLRDPRTAQVYRAELLEEGTPPGKQGKPKIKPAGVTNFFKEPKLDEGAQFLLRHSLLLNGVSARYRVAPKDVMAVLMWQSNLGKATGELRLVNLFLGRIIFLRRSFELAVKNGRRDTPEGTHARRVQDAQLEAVASLATLLRFCKARGLDPLEVHGTALGGAGVAQFTPDNLRWLEDGDDDGRITLDSVGDAAAGIASCLAASGYAQNRLAGLKGYNPVDDWAKGVMTYADRVEARGSAPAKVGTAAVARPEVARLADQAGEDGESTGPPAPPPPPTTGTGRLRVLTFEAGAWLWASVYIDGRPAATKVTPLTAELPVGRHTVKVERPGYRTIERDVQIEEGKTEVLKLELEP